MASLGNYTTTEAVRACLGLDDNDCPDAVMLDSNMDDELLLDLGAWLPTHAAIFESVDPEDADNKKRIQMYAQWFCAHEVALRPWTVPKTNSDGKAKLARFDVNANEVALMAASKMAQYKAALLGDLGEPVASAAYVNLFSVNTPAADPVTEGIQ